MWSRCRRLCIIEFRRLTLRAVSDIEFEHIPCGRLFAPTPFHLGSRQVLTPKSMGRIRPNLMPGSCVLLLEAATLGGSILVFRDPNPLLDSLRGSSVDI